MTPDPIAVLVLIGIVGIFIAFIASTLLDNLRYRKERAENKNFIMFLVGKVKSLEKTNDTLEEELKTLKSRLKKFNLITNRKD